MQNDYAVERFMQERNAHARAVAELQALRRKAAGERRGVSWDTWRMRIGQWFSRGVGTVTVARQGRDRLAAR